MSYRWTPKYTFAEHTFAKYLFRISTDDLICISTCAHIFCDLIHIFIYVYIYICMVAAKISQQSALHFLQ